MRDVDRAVPTLGNRMPHYTGVSYPIYLIVGAVCLTAAWLRKRLHSVTVGALGRPPSVTVLVPAFNEEDGLGDTLKSLSLQTYPDLRVVVVDDCSTDATVTSPAAFPERPGVSAAESREQGAGPELRAFQLRWRPRAAC